MGENYEVIVVGAGHNGLLAAAYLARAGVKVCVVERLDYVGGGVVTRDGLAAPGFKTDICSVVHGMIQANPLIVNDELGLLSKYGLKYVFPDPQIIVHYDDGSYMKIFKDIDRTCESIAQFSEKDAVAYRKFHDWSQKILDLITVGLFSPPPSFPHFMSVLHESDEGRELARSMMISPLNIIDSFFENEKVRILATRWASEVGIKPQSMGTGLVLFLMIPLLHKYGWGLALGGSGALSEAIKECLLEDGGIVKLSSPVKKFKVDRGECKGVVLESGEEIHASKAVVANLHVKQIFNQMLSETELPTGFQDTVSKILPSDFSTFVLGLALDKKPGFKASEEFDQALSVEFSPTSMVDYLRYFDELSYGSYPKMHPYLSCVSFHDKSRAPEGKHTMSIGTYAPYNLREGGGKKWDEIREQTAERLLDYMRQHMTNLEEEDIVGKHIMSPLDLERHNPAMMYGDFGTIGAHLHQTAGNRPLPAWNYRTPVARLYMCGASCHPGGSVIGGGRAAVQVVMEDLDIDFENVIS
jgi:phytoene dehydrogenase-like protein